MAPTHYRAIALLLSSIDGTHEHQQTPLTLVVSLSAQTVIGVNHKNSTNGAVFAIGANRAIGAILAFGANICWRGLPIAPMNEHQWRS